MNPQADESNDSNQNTPPPTPGDSIPRTSPTSPQSGMIIIPSASTPQPFGSSVDPNSQPLHTVTTASSSKKRTGLGKKMLVAVTVLLLVGMSGGVFAYVSIMNNSPEKILADALSHTMTDILAKKPSQMTGKLTFTSKEADSPYSVVIDFDAKQAGANGQLGATVHVKAGEEFDLTISGTTIGQGSEAAYVKFDNVQKTVDDLVAMYPEGAKAAATAKPFIQKIDGQWIKIDKQGFAKYGMAESQQTIDACAKALEGLRISESDQNKVKEIFLNNQFAIATEELPGEAVDGDESYHYKLDLNEEAGLRFAKDFMQLESFSKVKEACKLKQGDIDKSLEDLKKQSDEEAQAEPIFELWVSQKTRRPTKIKIAVDDKEFTMENIATIKLDAPNIAVDIPAKFITLQELTADIDKLSTEGQALGWSARRH